MRGPELFTDFSLGMRTGPARGAAAVPDHPLQGARLELPTAHRPR